MAAADTPNHPEGADEAQVGRRVLLRGISAMGLAAFATPALVACGDDDEPAVAGPDATPEPTVETTPEPTATGKATKTPKPEKTASAEPTATAKGETPKATPKETKAPSGGGTPDGPSFADASMVPVGSGALFEADEIIVTQPTAGKFLGFDSLCTHEGCIIDVFEGNQMVCTCHNSKFNITDGKPTAGPAKKPVPPKKIVVVDGKIYKAK